MPTMTEIRRRGGSTTAVKKKHYGVSPTLTNGGHSALSSQQYVLRADTSHLNTYLKDSTSASPGNTSQTLAKGFSNQPLRQVFPNTTGKANNRYGNSAMEKKRVSIDESSPYAQNLVGSGKPKPKSAGNTRDKNSNDFYNPEDYQQHERPATAGAPVSTPTTPAGRNVEFGGRREYTNPLSLSGQGYNSRNNVDESFDSEKEPKSTRRNNNAHKDMRFGNPWDRLSMGLPAQARGVWSNGEDGADGEVGHRTRIRSASSLGHASGSGSNHLATVHTLRRSKSAKTRDEVNKSTGSTRSSVSTRSEGQRRSFSAKTRMENNVRLSDPTNDISSSKRSSSAKLSRAGGYTGVNAQTHSWDSTKEPASGHVVKNVSRPGHAKVSIQPAWSDDDLEAAPSSSDNTIATSAAAVFSDKENKGTIAELIHRFRMGAPLSREERMKAERASRDMAQSGGQSTSSSVQRGANANGKDKFWWNKLDESKTNMSVESTESDGEAAAAAAAAAAKAASPLTISSKGSRVITGARASTIAARRKQILEDKKAAREKERKEMDTCDLNDSVDTSSHSIAGSSTQVYPLRPSHVSSASPSLREDESNLTELNNRARIALDHMNVTEVSAKDVDALQGISIGQDDEDDLLEKWRESNRQASSAATVAAAQMDSSPAPCEDPAGTIQKIRERLTTQDLRNESNDKFDANDAPNSIYSYREDMSKKEKESEDTTSNSSAGAKNGVTTNASGTAAKTEPSVSSTKKAIRTGGLNKSKSRPEPSENVTNQTNTTSEASTVASAEAKGHGDGSMKVTWMGSKGKQESREAGIHHHGIHLSSEESGIVDSLICSSVSDWLFDDGNAAKRRRKNSGGAEVGLDGEDDSEFEDDEVVSMLKAQVSLYEHEIRNLS